MDWTNQVGFVASANYMGFGDFVTVAPSNCEPWDPDDDPNVIRSCGIRSDYTPADHAISRCARTLRFRIKASPAAKRPILAPLLLPLRQLSAFGTFAGPLRADTLRCTDPSAPPYRCRWMRARVAWLIGGRTSRISPFWSLPSL